MQYMCCVRLLENRTEKTSTRFRVCLKVQYHVVACLQNFCGERSDYSLQLRREVNVVVESLHLIAEQPHDPYVFGYQYCSVLLCESGCSRSLSSTGFAAKEMKGWCNGHGLNGVDCGEA